MRKEIKGKRHVRSESKRQAAGYGGRSLAFRVRKVDSNPCSC